MLSELQLHLKKKVVNEYSFLSWQTLIKWKQTGLSCSKLGLDNPGLVWNRISALEALKENSVEFFLSTIWWLDAPYRVEENDPKKAIKQRSIETQIKI